MKTTRLKIPCFFTILLAFSALAGAATIPDGSYKKTCTLIVPMGNTLQAVCKDLNGKYKSTTLQDIHLCKGGISNQNGNLRCLKGDPPPSGSYQLTCVDARLVGSTLYATCETRSGKWRSTSISDLSTCRAKIANIDGYLTCDRGSVGAPHGSYKETCRDVVANGTTLEALCKQKNGLWTFTRLEKFNECKYGISNQDGYLQCNAPTSGGGSTSGGEPKGEPCDEKGQCKKGFACSFLTNRCIKAPPGCGNIGSACCAPSFSSDGCDSGLRCIGGACQPCGAQGQVCCIKDINFQIRECNLAFSCNGETCQ